MTIRKLVRLPYKPRGVRQKFVAQTIRLTDAENKRLKRAAKKDRASFNAWAVNVLNEAADRALNPPPPTTTGETTLGTSSEQTD